MGKRKIFAIIIFIAILGLVLNAISDHYRGGEIYEAANHAYGLLTRGFNVTISVETVDGRDINGTLVSVRGSTIYVNVNGSIVTIGGPQATKEDVRARVIKVVHHGKVFIYRVTPKEGNGLEVFSSLLPEDCYSARYSGIIYIEGNVSPIRLGKLKYEVDYTTYGSVTIHQLGNNGAIITTNKAPVQYLLKALEEYRVYTYGVLYVNSDENNMPLKLIGVENG